MEERPKSSPETGGAARDMVDGSCQSNTEVKKFQGNTKMTNNQIFNFSA